MAHNMLERYRTEIVPALRRDFGYTNPMQVPQVRKIVTGMNVPHEAERLLAALGVHPGPVQIGGGQARP